METQIWCFERLRLYRNQPEKCEMKFWRHESRLLWGVSKVNGTERERAGSCARTYMNNIFAAISGDNPREDGTEHKKHPSY